MQCALPSNGGHGEGHCLDQPFPCNEAAVTIPLYRRRCYCSCIIIGIIVLEFDVCRAPLMFRPYITAAVVGSFLLLCHRPDVMRKDNHPAQDAQRPRQTSGQPSAGKQAPQLTVAGGLSLGSIDIFFHAGIDEGFCARSHGCPDSLRCGAYNIIVMGTPGYGRRRFEPS